MKLFINAGGKGTRLYQLTKETPKPMVPILGKPVLEHLIEWAKRNEISEIVLMTGYKAELIEDYFKDGNGFGMRIHHSVEPYPLGSGGPIKFAEKHVKGRFVYVSGDQICTVNLKKMLKFHTKNNADMTIFVNKTDHPEDSDTLRVDQNGKVTHFLTKFEPKEAKDNLSNRGLCIIEPKILSLMDKEIFNFENEIYPKMLTMEMNLMTYETDEFMEDMGTPERLKKCEEYLRSKEQ